jgi:hypothetical protein
MRHEILPARRRRHHAAPDVTVERKTRAHFFLHGLRQPGPCGIEGGEEIIAGEAERERGDGKRQQADGVQARGHPRHIPAAC